MLRSKDRGAGVGDQAACIERRRSRGDEPSTGSLCSLSPTVRTHVFRLYSENRLVKMDCEPNRVRLMCMLGLTAGFFVAEVVVSRLTSSLAMLSDSFHMLSDVIALLVALVAVRFASRTQATSKNTFGWIRAEVMGALVNAVFLTALCFTIILEAVERFTEPHEIESPQVVIGVGAAGLLVNLLGLCMFHGHSGGGGHGHSHGGHSHGGRKGKRAKGCKADRPGGASGEETNLVGTCGSPNGVNADRAGESRSGSFFALFHRVKPRLAELAGHQRSGSVHRGYSWASPTTGGPAVS